MHTQLYDHNGELIKFTDAKANYHSAKCQPRDIEIITAGAPDVREDIAIDIRLGQGFPVVGVAKGLLYK